jgi:lipopolysaccharide biosynthesis regulator YciM
MKRTILTGLLVAAAGLSSLAAQQQPAQSKPPAAGQPAQGQAPAAQPKGPAPKSQKELAALQALFGAKDPDSTIKAADALITGFADTDFKDIALIMAADAYQRKNDPEKAIIYAERALDANKSNFQAMLMIAEILAQRKKYDVAITELKMAVDGVGGQEPAFQVRLAQAYALSGKNDEAIAVCNQVLANPNLHPQIKQVAEALKDGATKAKTATVPKPSTSGPQQVEIKQP